MRCLVELHEHLRTIGRIPSWEFLSSCLKRMNEIELANQIDSKYIITPFRQSSVGSEGQEVMTNSTTSDDTTVAVIPVTRERNKNINVPPEITSEFRSLFDRFTLLNLKIKNAFLKSRVNFSDVQHVINRQCGLEPLVGKKTTFDVVFRRLEQNCSIFDSHVLVFLIKTFLSRNQILQRELKDYRKAVDAFKSSAKMGHLVHLIEGGSSTGNSADCRNVKLKVKEFWNHFTIKQFEKAMTELLGTLYDHVSQISVVRKCLCIEWIIPDIDTTNMIPRHSLEFTRIIGVLSLHIGDDVLYDHTTEKGSEVLDAAMLEAIQLKKTKAIEFFLAMGCNPEVATYNGDNAVTTIVNIRESKKSSVDYVCIIGHNEHVEAIVDPSSKPAECSSCNMNEKMNKQLHQQNDTLHQENYALRQEKTTLVEQTTLHSLTDQLQLTVKAKDAEFEELTEQMKDKATKYESTKNELLRLKEEIKIKDAENTLLKKNNQLLIKEKQPLMAIIANSTTAVLPRQQLGIGAEMRVKIITRDSSGKELDNGGSAVRAVLSCNEEECRVTDNKDGTYFVTVIPQQLGQHQLSITIDNQHIQNSPFSLTIVPQRDYTKLKEPVQTITGIKWPRFIAFSNNGDMFVISAADHCIHVYDKSGNKKTTIGSKGSGELQFNSPLGIDINGDIVYVAEWGGDRIRKLTTGGEFISTFGEYGSAINQFNGPHDVKISPDNKVYVADRGNQRVQVFHSDWTISHVIDGRVSGDGGFSRPEGIAFDLFGNVHVTGFSPSSVTVFTPSGQFIRQYYTTHISDPVGIAIDPSGYSLVADYGNGTLSVFDARGVFIHSVGGLQYPHGVSVANDGGVWVADTDNHRLVKY